MFFYNLDFCLFTNCIDFFNVLTGRFFKKIYGYLYKDLPKIGATLKV